MDLRQRPNLHEKGTDYKKDYTNERGGKERERELSILTCKRGGNEGRVGGGM